MNEIPIEKRYGYRPLKPGVDRITDKTVFFVPHKSEWWKYNRRSIGDLVSDVATYWSFEPIDPGEGNEIVPWDECEELYVKLGLSSLGAYKWEGTHDGKVWFQVLNGNCTNLSLPTIAFRRKIKKPPVDAYLDEIVDGANERSLKEHGKTLCQLAEEDDNAQMDRQPGSQPVGQNHIGGANEMVAHRWIPVSERLPERNGRQVLGFWLDSAGSECIQLFHGDYQFKTAAKTWASCHSFHWQYAEFPTIKSPEEVAFESFCRESEVPIDEESRKLCKFAWQAAIQFAEQKGKQ